LPPIFIFPFFPEKVKNFFASAAASDYSAYLLPVRGRRRGFQPEGFGSVRPK
jgi:hypothetical protein